MPLRPKLPKASSESAYAESDREYDCSPLRGLVTDESSFVLPAEEARHWYLVRLELLCLDAGRVVLRPGASLMSNHRPIQFNSTVILSHRRAPAVGSVCAMSEDRHFLEEQLKILEEQVNGRAQTQTGGGAGAGGGGDHANSGAGGGTGRYAEAAGEEGSPEDEGGVYSHSGSDDWDPDTHTSTDSELETKRRCLPKPVKREYSASKKPKPRGPSLRAELTHKRHSSGMRSFTRMSKETPPAPTYKFNTLRPSDFQPYSPALAAHAAHTAHKPDPLPLPPHPTAATITMTFDQQSQTEPAGGDDPHALRSVVVLLQEEVSRLGQMVGDMRAKMEYMQSAMGVNPDIFDTKYDVREEIVEQESARGSSVSCGTPAGARARGTHARKQVLGELNRSGQQRGRHYRTPNREEHNTSNSYGSDAESEYSADMVPIGSGKTLVPRAIYSQINWHSYTIATRKLLMAVFPRRTLATHSLTGKASPAFTSKPAKLRLDLKKVTDIVMTVAENCGVREGLVRSCITTKCADENKMYRMRLQKKAKKAKKSADEDPARMTEDQENTPPPPPAVRKSEVMEQQYTGNTNASIAAARQA